MLKPHHLPVNTPFFLPVKSPMMGGEILANLYFFCLKHMNFTYFCWCFPYFWLKLKSCEFRIFLLLIYQLFGWNHVSSPVFFCTSHPPPATQPPAVYGNQVPLVRLPGAEWRCPRSSESPTSSPEKNMTINNGIHKNSNGIYIYLMIIIIIRSSNHFFWIPMVYIIITMNNNAIYNNMVI